MLQLDAFKHLVVLISARRVGAVKVLIILSLVFSLLGLASCTAEELRGQSSGSATTGGVSAASQAPDDSGWQQVGDAMDLRSLRFSTEQVYADATIVRLDPEAYKISVKYDVANAGTVRDWFNALKPVALINGGYFDVRGRPTALVVFDGIRRGESYEGFGGMVVINAEGKFELRSLRQQPYDPDEPLQQAMQSSPMLIQPGGTVSELEPDTDRSRRTVIARDTQGRILLIVVSAPVFTLPELAQILKHSDLELDAALNLDGGRSTGLYLRTDAAIVKIDSMERLPLVLAVEQR